MARVDAQDHKPELPEEKAPDSGMPHSEQPQVVLEVPAYGVMLHSSGQFLNAAQPALSTEADLSTQPVAKTRKQDRADVLEI